MDADIYYHGRECGRAIAKDMRETIISSSKDNLAVLAGEKIHDAVMHSDVPFVKTKSWQEGCFEGFMEKAEQLRGENER